MRNAKVLGNLRPLLVVDDSDEDFEIIESCLGTAGLQSEIIHLRDGNELVAYLNASAADRPVKLPVAILLDLNLPGISGHALLETIRRHPTFATTPVIVLSTSYEPDDVNLAYQRGANSYLVKPLSLEGFEKLMQTFHRFWLETVALPVPQPRPAV